MTLTHFYFRLPNSNISFLFSSRFLNSPTRAKEHTYLRAMLDADKIGAFGFTNNVNEVDMRGSSYNIAQAEFSLTKLAKLEKVKRVREIPIDMDLGKFELDNLDWAELVEGDNGICVENEHGTQFSISELSNAELDVVLGIYELHKQGVLN